MLGWGVQNGKMGLFWAYEWAEPGQNTRKKAKTVTFFRLCLSLGVFAKMVAFVAFSKGVLAEIVV